MWSVGQLDGWLVSQMVSWLVDQWDGQSVGQLVCLSVFIKGGFLVSWLVGRSIGLLVSW